MSVLVRNLQRKLAVDCRLLQRQAERARNLFASARYVDHDLTITLTTNFHMTVLNGKYALLRKPTDVLTFRLLDASPRRHPSSTNPALDRTLQDELHALRAAPYLDLATGELLSPPAEADHDAEDLRPVLPNVLGDIFLSVEYCHRVARERRMRRHEYLLLAAVHGMAHLVGYTHDTRAKRKVMKEAEVEVLDALRESYGFEADGRVARDAGKPFMPRSYLP